MQAAVLAKRIQCLVHFTKLGNVGRILTEGLKPRTTLAQEATPFSYCDELRLDGHTDATCLSISFPNYKMFYRARRANQLEKWAVLLLAPNILWEKNCAFFKTNAASVHSTALNIEDRKTPAAFLELFEDRMINNPLANETAQVSLRNHYKLPTCYTTDPQAEVLCFGNIEKAYIKYIVFMNDTDKASIDNIPQQISSLTNNVFFNGRTDYEAWR